MHKVDSWVGLQGNNNFNDFHGEFAMLKDNSNAINDAVLCAESSQRFCEAVQ